MESKPNIFLFHGPDTYSSAHKIRVWLSEFAKKHGVNNSIILDCQSKDSNAVHILKNFFGIHSLFGYTKLVVLKNVWTKEGKETAEYLVENLASLPPTYFTVIHAETADARTNLMKKISELEKQGRASIEHFALPVGSDLSRWISDHVVRRGGSVSRDALNHFTQSLEGSGFKAAPSYDLWMIGHEIEKLISYANGRMIERHDVDLLFSRPLNAHAFDLVDTILARNSGEAYRLLHELLSDHSSQSKSSTFGILSLLKTQLKSLVIVKDLCMTQSDADIAQALSWNPKRVFAVKRKIERISLDRLKKMYALLLKHESDFFFIHTSPSTTIDLLATQLLSS